ncbi:MAG: SCP2 sterol-binding domain-containing protein [Moraxella sp.]|nr:SCP2 sterol-binding domain-containing protein [Moraxella sp.]
MAQFLSEEWFTEVANLNEQAGALNLPPNLANLLVNVQIDGDTPITLHLQQGKLTKGLIDNAASKVLIDKEVLYSIITGRDVNAVIEAFMMGKIRIEGDMSQVMALQTAKPSPEQKALYKQILAMTEL